MTSRHLLGATALVGSLAFATAAHAQAQSTTAPSVAGAPAAQDHTAPTDATSAADRRVDQASAEGTPASDGSDVVVTGSRIRSPNNESISPITTVTGAELLESGRISVGDALNDLPQLRTTLGSQNSITSSLGLRGIVALDLRGLGTTRTLTLVNGRREVAADIINNREIVDTNTIPADLIQRVDVLTGGASAVYGSDAIAGVVNFVLNDHFDGLEAHARSGITIPYGDAGDQLVSLVGGHNFDGGRGNIAIDAEFAHQSQYSTQGRPKYSTVNGFVTVGTDTTASGGSDGIPDSLYLQDIRSTTISLGGQLGFRQANALTAPCGLDSNPNPTANAVTAGLNQRQAYTCAYLFQPDGSLVAQTGQRVGIGPNGSFIGGNGYSGREGNLTTLSPELNRVNISTVGHYDFSPALTAFFEARYTRSKARGSSSGPFFSQGQTLGDSVAIAGFVDNSYVTTVGNTNVDREGVRIDNPYLSASARATIVAQLNQSIRSGVNPNTGAIYATANGQAVANGGVLTATGAAQQAAALAEVAAGTFRFSVRRNWLDLGIRDEDIDRQQFKLVGGIRGDFLDNFHYELSTNYGEHDELNTIIGNVNRQRFLLAQDTAINPATGQIVCRAQLDPRYAVTVSTATGTAAQKAAILAADVAACVPLNPFGQGSVSQAALNYLTSNTQANGRATQFVVNGTINGDLSKLFSLPGGPIGFAIGGEYRRETLYYNLLDPLTQGGYAFYNAIGNFAAPAFEVKEAFGEVRLPILKDLPFAKELTLNGSGRVSDYKGGAGTVYTYEAGGTYAPINDLRFRGSVARAVRAPYLGDLYAPLGQNFAPGFVDPCSSNQIATGTTYRAANCAAAGAPAGYNYVYSSSLEIKSGGNQNLGPETSNSYTAGVVLTPSMIPGLTLSYDYYHIKVSNVIGSVSAQTIVNSCYDLPTLNNPFCGLFQRAGASGGPRGEQQFRIIEGSLLQVPANFAKSIAAGFDVDLTYNHRFDFGTVALNGQWTHVTQRDQYTNPSLPNFKDVIAGELGDPQDAFNISADLKVKKVTFGYSFRWIGHQYIGAYELYNTVNGNPPQNADQQVPTQYPIVTYSDIRAGYDLTDRYSISFGVNNIADTIPPFGLVGSGAGAIYDNRGRFGYVAVRAKLF